MEKLFFLVDDVVNWILSSPRENAGEKYSQDSLDEAILREHSPLSIVPPLENIFFGYRPEKELISDLYCCVLFTWAVQLMGGIL